MTAPRRRRALDHRDREVQVGERRLVERDRERSVRARITTVNRRSRISARLRRRSHRAPHRARANRLFAMLLEHVLPDIRAIASFARIRG